MKCYNDKESSSSHDSNCRFLEDSLQYDSVSMSLKGNTTNLGYCMQLFSSRQSVGCKPDWQDFGSERGYSH